MHPKLFPLSSNRKGFHHGVSIWVRQGSSERQDVNRLMNSFVKRRVNIRLILTTMVYQMSIIACYAHYQEYSVYNYRSGY